MYERILEADLVVADISTGNRNAIYELGVRHALRPHTTIIIGEDSNTKIPFDLNHIVIRKYRHLGEDIGASEARRMSNDLTTAIKELLAAQDPPADAIGLPLFPDSGPRGPALHAPRDQRAAGESPQSTSALSAQTSRLRRPWLPRWMPGIVIPLAILPQSQFTLGT